MRTRAQDDADYGDGAHLAVTVNVHVWRGHDRARCRPTRIRAGPRSTFDGYRHASDVTLFLRTAELRELRDLLDRHPHRPDRRPPTPLLIPPVARREGVTDRAA